MRFGQGDRVYCPIVGGGIYTLDFEHYDHKVAFAFDGVCYQFDMRGRLRSGDHAPSIVHATQDNYELLSKLYPSVCFERPKKLNVHTPTIQKMLDRGWDSVPCVVFNDVHDYPCRVAAYIKRVRDDGQCVDTQDGVWRWAIPIDPRTGNKIIDYVDDEPVLWQMQG